MLKWPTPEFNFHHTVVVEAPVRASTFLWNMRDFSHVNWVHRNIYGYAKVIVETQNVTLVEYGVKRLFFLGLNWSFPTIMWNEFIPPLAIRHLSRNPWGGYTQVNVQLEEFEQEGKIHTRATNVYSSVVPRLFLPLRRFLKQYIDSWGAKLWKDDYQVLVRRQRVLDLGFRDHPVDVS